MENNRGSPSVCDSACCPPQPPPPSLLIISSIANCTPPPTAPPRHPMRRMFCMRCGRRTSLIPISVDVHPRGGSLRTHLRSGSCTLNTRVCKTCGRPRVYTYGGAVCVKHTAYCEGTVGSGVRCCWLRRHTQRIVTDIEVVDRKRPANYVVGNAC
jgi:hypothetical protein